MVIVVPTFAGGHKRNQPIVAAVLIGLVILIAKQVRQTIHAPRDVPHQDGANKHTPHHHACGEIQRAVPIHPDAANGKRRCEEHHALRDIKPQRTGWIFLQPHIERIL